MRRRVKKSLSSDGGLDLIPCSAEWLFSTLHCEAESDRAPGNKMKAPCLDKGFPQRLEVDLVRSGSSSLQGLDKNSGI